MGLFDRKTSTRAKRSPTKTEVVEDNRSEWVPTSVPVKSKSSKNPDGTPFVYHKRIYYCKSCGYSNAIQTRYCPDCGRKCKD